MRRLLAALLLLSATVATPAWAALKPGAPAPDFNVKAALAGKDFNFSLKDALKTGPVVLYFFPAAFTAGCTAEAHAFAEATDEFKRQGATLIGLTAGNIDRVSEFSRLECRDKFAVGADPGARIAKSYDARIALMPGVSARTSYVIGTDGRIAYTYSNLNPNKHVDNTMAALKAWKARAKG